MPDTERRRLGLRKGRHSAGSLSASRRRSTGGRHSTDLTPPPPPEPTPTPEAPAEEESAAAQLESFLSDPVEEAGSPPEEAVSPPEEKVPSRRHHRPRFGAAEQDSWPRAGPRRAALQERKRARRRSRARFSGLGVILAIAAVALGVYLVADDDNEAGAGTGVSAIEGAEDPITTTLLFGTRQPSDGSGDRVVWMTLLSTDERTGSGAVVYVPAHTATEVPGRGLLPLGESLRSGGIPLLLVSTETKIGVQIDRYLELSEQDARVLFGEVGEVSVDVPAPVVVPAGEQRVRIVLAEGPQRLGPEFLVDLLYTLGIDGDDAELGGRHLAFWSGLLEGFSEDPIALGAAIERAGPSLGTSDASPTDHAQFFTGLARLPGTERTLANLPVEQVSVGGDELYDVDKDQVAAFISETIGSVEPLEDEIRVQILNGNGVPGIGQEVAEKLVGEGYRVLLSGNAQRLDYFKTRIVTYDSSEGGLDAAERARELLGVGEVQISSQGQGIVDLTVVVGRDFVQQD